MASVGIIYQTKVEIDEDGNIWCIFNHFESDSVIEEMEAVAQGEFILDDGYELALSDADFLE